MTLSSGFVFKIFKVRTVNFVPNRYEIDRSEKHSEGIPFYFDPM